jgi:tRNA G18 (ribose-2'-O)-methylase SpoU
MDITSLQNPRVKYFVKLRDDKKQRQKDGLMLVEGFDEIQLAFSAGHKPQTLLSAPELVSRLRKYPIAITPMAGWQSFPFRIQLWNHKVCCLGLKFPW